MKHAWLLLAILFAGTILWAHPCAADGALAVGIPPNVKKQGFVWGYGVGNNADRQALGICRGTDVPPGITMPASASEAQKRCTIVGHVSDQCYAIAFDVPNLAPGATGVGWGIAAKLMSAEDQALAMCKASAPPARKAECRVNARDCDGAAK